MEELNTPNGNPFQKVHVPLLYFTQYLRRYLSLPPGTELTGVWFPPARSTHVFASEMNIVSPTWHPVAGLGRKKKEKEMEWEQE